MSSVAPCHFVYDDRLATQACFNSPTAQHAWHRDWAGVEGPNPRLKEVGPEHCSFCGVLKPEPRRETHQWTDISRFGDEHREEMCAGPGSCDTRRRQRRQGLRGDVIDPRLWEILSPDGEWRLSSLAADDAPCNGPRRA